MSFDLPKPEPAAEERRMLVNKLTVADGRRMLRSEGGELTTQMVVWRALSTVVTMGLLAWAIAEGKATTWHLLVPYVGVYLAMLVGIVVAYAVTRLQGLRKEALQCLRLLVGIPAVLAVVVLGRAGWSTEAWPAQLSADATLVWGWVIDSKVHWATLWAAIDTLSALPRRVQMLRDHGPPFMGASIGCAMRLLIPFFGVFLAPFAAAALEKWHTGWIVWAVWMVFVLADLGALWMHWDLQRRLRKHDALE